MIKLKRRNIVRIVQTDHQAAELIAAGFTVINKQTSAGAKAPAENPAEQSDHSGNLPNTSLEDLTVGQLRAIASEKGIKGVTCLRKADLLELLKGA